MSFTLVQKCTRSGTTFWQIGSTQTSPGLSVWVVHAGLALQMKPQTPVHGEPLSRKEEAVEDLLGVAQESTKIIPIYQAF